MNIKDEPEGKGIVVANTLRDFEYEQTDGNKISFKRFVLKTIPDDVWEMLRNSPEGKEFFLFDPPGEQRREYEGWLRSLTDSELRAECNKWAQRPPLRTENLGFVGCYWTLDLAEKEMNRRTREKVEENAHLRKDLTETNRLLGIAQDKTLSMKKRLRTGELPSKEELQQVADKTRGKRFERRRETLKSPKLKSEKLNYSAIGRELGVSHHTAKRWCQIRGIL